MESGTERRQGTPSTRNVPGIFHPAVRLETFLPDITGEGDPLAPTLPTGGASEMTWLTSSLVRQETLAFRLQLAKPLAGALALAGQTHDSPRLPLLRRGSGAPRRQCTREDPDQQTI